MSKAWAGGSSRAQRQQRADVILRAGGLCELQLEGCDVYATTSHHVNGIKVSGKVVANPALELKAACAHCNQEVGDPTRNDPDPHPPATQW